MVMIMGMRSKTELKSASDLWEIHLTYRLISQIMNQTVEKSVTPFLYYNISCRFSIKWLAIKIIRRRIHGLSFLSIHLAI